jgi:hypothetical protein
MTHLLQRPPTATGSNVSPYLPVYGHTPFSARDGSSRMGHARVDHWEPARERCSGRRGAARLGGRLANGMRNNWQCVRDGRCCVTFVLCLCSVKIGVGHAYRFWVRLERWKGKSPTRTIIYRGHVDP